MGEIEKIGNETRVLHDSRIYESSNKQLPRALAGVIRKMHHSPRVQVVDLLDPEVPRICMAAEHWYWGRLSGVKDVNDTRMPRSHAAEFVLLRDLGGGADGRVWRACTRGGIGASSSSRTGKTTKTHPLSNTSASSGKPSCGAGPGWRRARVPSAWAAGVCLADDTRVRSKKREAAVNKMRKSLGL